MPRNTPNPTSVAKGAIFATLCTAALCMPTFAYADTVEPTTSPQNSPTLASQGTVPDQTPNVDTTPLVTPETMAPETATGGGSSTAGDTTGSNTDTPSATGDEAPDTTGDNIQPAATSDISYDYDATLYSPTGNEADTYTGVYTATLQNNAGAQDPQTIGFPSIADANLPDAPTTESPAIIQGAAVGYEQKTGAVEYTKIKDRDEPYADFTYTILEEQGPDGTVHKKLSGFDGTYVIARLNVDDIFANNPGTYLHMRQEDNRAMLVAIGMLDKNRAFCGTITTASGDYKAGGIYVTGSYTRQDLLDLAGADRNNPYIDVIVFATAANVAGADAGKTGALNGDIPLLFYVDDTAAYNNVVYDPQSTDPNHIALCLSKFYDASKTTPESISRYLLKGSDLALETMVADSGGPSKDTGTTYWSLTKSFEHPYYDQEIDKSPTDPGCGRTVKLMSEVAVTQGIELTGTDADNLKKRTLDVNSFDVQIATNTEGGNDGFTLDNAWLTIADKSNTTGAEFAIGNNARMTINSGGKLIIDETCQLEIEWDGATATTPTAQAEKLNNGMLDLRAGGEVVNNGIITIEGTEGKPYQPNTSQQVINSEKGFGEFTIRPGATLTNNGSLVVYGRLYNLGTIVNNGKYNENPIVSNDPDKGQFAYHRGIQISWKDDVTQQNVTMGELHNGRDTDGNVYAEALLNNFGDIVLVPGNLYNWGIIVNEEGANIYLCAATEAIIPIEPPTPTSTITHKRITLDPPVASLIENWGTLINRGRILPASVELLDNTGFGRLTEFGDNPDLFQLINHGTIVNDGYIYGWDKTASEATMATTAIGRLSAKLPGTADPASAVSIGSIVTAGLGAIIAGRRRRK